MASCRAQKAHEMGRSTFSPPRTWRAVRSSWPIPGTRSAAHDDGRRRRPCWCCIGASPCRHFVAVVVVVVAVVDVTSSCRWLIGRSCGCRRHAPHARQRFHQVAVNFTRSNRMTRRRGGGRTELAGEGVRQGPVRSAALFWPRGHIGQLPVPHLSRTTEQLQNVRGFCRRDHRVLLFSTIPRCDNLLIFRLGVKQQNSDLEPAQQRIDGIHGSFAPAKLSGTTKGDSTRATTE